MDYVIKEMSMEQYPAYLAAYPYMEYGTHIFEKRKDGSILVRRFIDQETCIRYCTAPTQSDLNPGKGPL